jgi:hypothetical protein
MLDIEAELTQTCIGFSTTLRGKSNEKETVTGPDEHSIKVNKGKEITISIEVKKTSGADKDKKGTGEKDEVQDQNSEGKAEAEEESDTNTPTSDETSVEQLDKENETTGPGTGTGTDTGMVAKATGKTTTMPGRAKATAGFVKKHQDIIDPSEEPIFFFFGVSTSKKTAYLSPIVESALDDPGPCLSGGRVQDGRALRRLA